MPLPVAFYSSPPCDALPPTPCLWALVLGAPAWLTAPPISSPTQQGPSSQSSLNGTLRWAASSGGIPEGLQEEPGNGSQMVPPSHLLAEEQREGWGCMPAEGAVLSRELRPSGTELPFPVRSGAASQPGQGRARQSSQNKQNKAGERASRTGPEPWPCRARARGCLGLLWTLDLPAKSPRRAH